MVGVGVECGCGCGWGTFLSLNRLVEIWYVVYVIDVHYAKGIRSQKKSNGNGFKKF